MVLLAPYIHICYGIHPIFNVVTHAEGIPNAVSIRAASEDAGWECISLHLYFSVPRHRVASGPGRLARVLQLAPSFNGTSLLADDFYITDDGLIFSPTDVVASPRMGIDSVGEVRNYPCRFSWRDHIAVSYPRPRI
jgi:DNA-3-methyladenine glycosylase